MVELVESNRAAVEKAVKILEAALPGSLTELAIKVLKETGGEAGLENVLLTSTTEGNFLKTVKRGSCGFL